MHKEPTSGPYTKLIGPEILAQDYSNHPLDRRLYGRWRCRDGREVLFNRGYRPLWERRPGQPVAIANPKEWVDLVERPTPRHTRTRARAVAEDRHDVRE